MNAKRIWVVARKELVDAFRDRRAVNGLVIGSLVGPVLLAVILNLQVRRQTVTEVRVPVTGGQYAPLLVDWLRQQPDVTVVDGPKDLETAQAVVRDGDEDFVLAIPEDYGKKFADMRPAQVQIVRDSTNNSSSGPRERLRRLIGQYSAEIGGLRLVARGVSPSVASAVPVADLEISTAQQRAARVLSMLPMMVLLAAFTAALQISSDSTAGERERGALESLLLNPVPRIELVTGKWLAAAIFAVIGMVATLGLMVGAFAMVPFADTGVRFSFTVAQVLQWLAVVLPAGLLAPAIEVYLASFARTFKEAQQYMGFVIMVPMLGLMGSMAFPDMTGLWLAPVPIFGQFELAKAILAGESPAAIWYVLSTLSLVACTAALIGLTARLFSSEKTHHRPIALGTYTEDRRMREINSVQRRLEWVQPGALKMYYELRSDNELIATWVSEAYWARSRPRRVRTDAGHSSASDSSRRERRFALADRTQRSRHLKQHLERRRRPDACRRPRVLGNHQRLANTTGNPDRCRGSSSSSSDWRLLAKLRHCRRHPKSDSKCRNCLGWHCLRGTSSS